MAITSYSGLSTAVYRRLDRTAETTVFDDCLALAEAEINRRLALAPVRPQHTRSTATLNAEYFATPTDILDVDNFAIDDDPILATTPRNIQAMFDDRDIDAQPRFYAQVGGEFRLYPSPDTSYSATLTYWAKVPALTSVATTNWLSLAHPDVYRAGVLAYAMDEYSYPQSDVQTQFDLFNVALQKVLDAYPKRQDRAPRVADWALFAPNRRFSIITG